MECHILDYKVYDRPDVAEQLSRRAVVAMKADVTDRDSDAGRWLRNEIRGAPPLTLIYPSDGRTPIRLVGEFSKSELLNALDAAAKRKPQGGR